MIIHIVALWFAVAVLVFGIGSLGVDVSHLKKQVNHIGERLCGDLYTCKTPEGKPYP